MLNCCDMTTNDFAQWLEKTLITNNLTASELARRAGVDKGVISRLINKERAPSPEDSQLNCCGFEIAP